MSEFVKLPDGVIRKDLIKKLLNMIEINMKEVLILE